MYRNFHVNLSRFMNGELFSLQSHFCVEAFPLLDRLTYLFRCNDLNLINIQFVVENLNYLNEAYTNFA